MADDGTSVDPGRATHLIGLIRSVVPPMHRGGRPIVGGLAVGTLVLRSGLRRVGAKRAGRLVTRAGLTASAASALFFRAPTRVTPADIGLIVAPADGVVALIEDAVPPEELGLAATPRPRVSIFLSVLDVHVQRAPVTGIVTHRAYRPGAFFSADLDKASTDNERNSLVIGAAGGGEIVVTQIAGLIARRILCDVDAGSQVLAGQTYGLIRFGSRVDTYLPVGTQPAVLLGQRTIGGETVLAKLRSPGTGAGPG
jgi:phosphatidylserine decarboxylase